MFTVTNMSNNPLSLSDGKSLAAGDSRKLKTVGDQEKDFQSRGWLLIIEDESKTTDGGKK